MLIVLFGLAGAGKNYVGQLLSEHAHLHFWDADEALTDEMRNCIEKKQSFTQKILDRYFDTVIENIKTLQKKHAHLIVAQAFYRDKNRQLILTTFADSVFVQVNTELNTLLTRLRLRNDNITEAYAKKISSEFEAPNHVYYQINNNIEHGHDQLLTQLRLIPGVGVLLS